MHVCRKIPVLWLVLYISSNSEKLNLVQFTSLTSENRCLRVSLYELVFKVSSSNDLSTNKMVLTTKMLNTTFLKLNSIHSDLTALFKALLVNPVLSLES